MKITSIFILLGTFGGEWFQQAFAGISIQHLGNFGRTGWHPEGCLLTFVMCDQAVIVPCFTPSWQRMHTQRKKVGSLLSCGWQLRKRMPIHSLGIETIRGPYQTLFLGACRVVGRFPFFTFHYSRGKKATFRAAVATNNMNQGSGQQNIEYKLYGDADFGFQQGLAPVYSHKSTNTWFNDYDITVLDLPASWPDPNLQRTYGTLSRGRWETSDNNEDKKRETIKAAGACRT